MQDYIDDFSIEEIEKFIDNVDDFILSVDCLKKGKLVPDLIYSAVDDIEDDVYIQIYSTNKVDDIIKIKFRRYYLEADLEKELEILEFDFKCDTMLFKNLFDNEIILPLMSKLVFCLIVKFPECKLFIDKEVLDFIEKVIFATIIGLRETAINLLADMIFYEERAKEIEEENPNSTDDDYVEDLLILKEELLERLCWLHKAVKKPRKLLEKFQIFIK